MVWIEADSQKMLELLPRVPKGVAVTMLNMLRFRETAAYPDGQARGVGAKGLRGLQCRGRMGHVADVGGKVIWFGRAGGTVIGPAGEAWDHIFLVRYPSAWNDLLK